ncbi:hypothetical protein [Rubrivivax gelatinosus]|uniref:Uncharacterized protein n=1 Tax=Rubrivivax gelatinosus TaxID=28068 RepID=A0A4R2M962_RUBGE|nr:hypothetical protein [Rubrivivax gelatinosus]TCP01515.1 hypothetical protein EV684_109154 [Rubrivivax gelatinosus]
MKRWLSSAGERWQRLGEAERRRVPLIAAALLLAALSALHAFVAHPARLKARGDLTRLEQRARQASQQAPVLPPGSLGARSPAALAREAAGLRGELERQRARLAALEPAFAPLDTLEPGRELVAALTALAEGADLNLTRLELQGLKREEQGQPPSAERMRQLAQAAPYQRPTMRFEAQASFRGLMQFLDGLSTLPYTVAPVWLSLEVRAAPAPAGEAPRLPWLEVKMDLTL